MRLTIRELRHRIACAVALNESEVYVDERGFAHDDEGNTWFVGKGNRGTYGGGSFSPGTGSGPVASRHRFSRPKQLRLTGAHTAALDALLRLTPDDRYVRVVSDRLRRGIIPSKLERGRLVKAFRSAGLDAEAALFEESLTEQAWSPGRFYPGGEPLDDDDAARLNVAGGRELGEGEEDLLDEVDLDPSNDPGRPGDAYEYIGMHPSATAAMSHPFANGSGGGGAGAGDVGPAGATGDAIALGGGGEAGGDQVEDEAL